jgi:hypothetical protein
MAEDADPDGQRTLGVLTKPDLVDRGAEEKVCTTLSLRVEMLIVQGHRTCNEPGW